MFRIFIVLCFLIACQSRNNMFDGGLDSLLDNNNNIPNTGFGSVTQLSVGGISSLVVRSVNVFIFANQQDIQSYLFLSDDPQFCLHVQRGALLANSTFIDLNYFTAKSNKITAGTYILPSNMIDDPFRQGRIQRLNNSCVPYIQRISNGGVIIFRQDIDNNTQNITGSCGLRFSATEQANCTFVADRCVVDDIQRLAFSNCTL